MGMNDSASGYVLVLPGGKVRSDRPSRSWQLANLRMAFVSRALRRRLGPDVRVQQVRYRLRGWNSPQLDALHDAEAVLDRARERFEPQQIAVVGHSMGGRVAAHLAARGDIGSVVALAPWWVGNDGDLIPVSTRLLVVHGTTDTWTDPRASRAQAIRARATRASMRGGWVSTEPATTCSAGGATGTASQATSSRSDSTWRTRMHGELSRHGRKAHRTCQCRDRDGGRRCPRSSFT